MGRIPQDVIDRVLAAHDIVDVVGRSVRLEKKGRVWKALCPFHEEKTPSFTVSPERQTFKCFGGCGKGGNVFGFLMERDGLKFPEAVRALAAEKGIVVPDGGGRASSSADASRTPALRAALAFAHDFFVRTLAGPAGAGARAYLERRGFAPPVAKDLELGLSPDAWDGLIVAAKAAGIAAATLEEAGLASKRERGDGWYDRFRGRLMFPIRDVSGRVVTFGARTLKDEQPKYLNGPETTVFKKGRTLYGLDRAKDGIKKAGHAILMEGYTDVLMAHVYGFTAAVAGMGTAFTSDQARALAAFTSTVVVLYDGDEAGLAAAERTLDVLLEQGLEVKVALLPTGRDVDEVLLEEGDGAERLARIVREALDFFDFKLARLAATLDLSTERGRATAAVKMAESLVRVKSPLERDLRFSAVADRLRVSDALLRAEAERLASGRRHRLAETPGTASPATAGATSPAEPVTPQERARLADLAIEQRTFVAAAIFAPEHAAAICASLPVEEVAEPALRTVYEAVHALAAQGLLPSAAAVGRLVAHDPGAVEAFAGLPDDVRFVDWVADHLRRREGLRSAGDRRSSVLQLLAQPTACAQDVPPAEAARRT
jgi:DNA primase